MKVALRNVCRGNTVIRSQANVVTVYMTGMLKEDLMQYGDCGHKTFLTLSVFASSINSDVLYACLTQDLLPKVSKNAVIEMDNATFRLST